ncbi:MAG: CoA-binding protein [Microcystaceae cyanobacterium]
MKWQNNLLTNQEDVYELLAQTQRVGFIGMKTEKQAQKPAFYVPQYLQSVGLEIIPVPVYYPEVTEILGCKVYRQISEIPGEIDIVDVFRRSDDIPQHLEDILTKQPQAVWFQSGIRNDEVAEKLCLEGIKVVQDRFLMVEYQRLLVNRPK